MQRSLLPIASLLLLLACESEGTQIGNEGIIDPAELTDPSMCTAKDFPGSTTVVGWPGSLQDAADVVIGSLAEAQLDDGTLVVDGMLTASVVRFHMIDGDCENLWVETELEGSFRSSLTFSAAGDLKIPFADPAFAEGELLTETWSGDLLPEPTAERTLVLDTALSPEGSSLDVVLETCDGDNCEDESYGVITPL